jgi:hypothetical protein
MVKIGLLLIILGIGSLVLKFLGFDLKFENFMGSAQPWILLTGAAVGAMLLFAGFMTER